jgi:hypothetical protein
VGILGIIGNLLSIVWFSRIKVNLSRDRDTTLKLAKKDSGWIGLG